MKTVNNQIYSYRYEGRYFIFKATADNTRCCNINVTQGFYNSNTNFANVNPGFIAPATQEEELWLLDCISIGRLCVHPLLSDRNLEQYQIF